MIRWPGEQCAQCAVDASQAEQRNVLNVLEARIADLEDRQLAMGRQLAAYQQIVQDGQRAHNALAQASERLATRLDQLVAHSAPNADLLP